MAQKTVSNAPNCVLQYHPDGYKADREQVKGRHSAGAGFLKGLIDHSGVDAFHCVAPSQAIGDDFAALVKTLDPKGRRANWIRPGQLGQIASVGTMFLPGPGLDEDAWRRRFADERGYSLVGVTHTVASDRAIRSIGASLTSPTQPWDALVCTSTSVRRVVERLIGHYGDFLERRGGRPASPIRLPVIPLGVDADAYAATDRTAGQRAGLRARLGIADGDVAAMFFGRLSFHAKAHPTAMFIAAERARVRVPDGRIHLMLVGQFPNDGIRDNFMAAAARHCPNVPVHVVDGSDPELARASWHAADVFVSLSDNIQESFGLTPIEAMAAGLPCLVSDYDGYKDTVPDGEVGFRVPTLTPGPGTGIEIADRHALGMETYDRFIGTASQVTAVDVAATATRLGDLAADPDLRRRMGEAGRARAAAVYDWRHVVSAYQELWIELAEIRRAGAGLGLRDPAGESARPDFPDPFDMFRDHATAWLTPEHLVSLGDGDLAIIRENDMHTFCSGRMLPEDATNRLVALLKRGPVRVAMLAVRVPDAMRNRLMLTLAWLNKYDIVRIE